MAKENPQTGMAEVNGTRLYYETAGKGPTIVLVHGGLVDSRLWNDQIKAFAKHQRVLRYDLRGFGRSAAAPEPFSHIEDLRGLMDFLKIDRATIVGLSLGGIVAADFALEYPERVERLVLVGSGLRGDKQPPDKDAIKAYEAASKGVAEEFVDVIMKSKLYAAVREGTPAYARLRQMMLENFKAVPTFRPGFLKYPEPPTIDRLESIRAPTLVVIGGEDAQYLKNVADTLAGGIPGARKVVIPGVSHHPPVERPKEFTNAILNFLKGKIKYPGKSVKTHQVRVFGIAFHMQDVAGQRNENYVNKTYLDRCVLLGAFKGLEGQVRSYRSSPTPAQKG